jgi:hypothetical protein
MNTPALKGEGRRAERARKGSAALRALTPTSPFRGRRRQNSQRIACQLVKICLSGSSQNAHTAEPTTSNAAATMNGACQLPI